MGSHTKNVLTVKGITASKARKLRDGGGLWLVTKGAGRYWIFDHRFGGKRREMGLGPLHTVGLAEARDRAEAARRLLRQGIDPIGNRAAAEIEAAKERAAVKTFGEYADAFVDDAVKAGRWRGASTEARWRNMLTNHAAPIRNKPLADIDVPAVLLALRTVWGSKQETAEKLREAIERVLDAAKVEGLRTGENPAAWRGNLEHVLHRPDSLTTTTSHAAMPFKAVPKFLTGLQKLETIGTRALEFTVLTAARSGEVRGATWGEIDLDRQLWIIPAVRMKGGREHRVPLSDRAIAILAEMQTKRLNDFVFPGVSEQKPISENTMSKVLRENGGKGFTVHGFRSAFRDWTTEATQYDGALAEMSLAHVVGDAVVRAYARSDALDRRRELMSDWSRFCTSKK